MSILAAREESNYCRQSDKLMAPRNSTLRHGNSFDSPSAPSLASMSQRQNMQQNDDDVLVDIKSISSQSINIQAEAEEEEIPLWVCGEPRYISGITEKTTCNDVIRALIEDEIRFIDDIENVDYISRDFRDYVITEKWRDIEQALPGETFILPIWNEWGVAQNEVKFKLKINNSKAEAFGRTNIRESKMEKPRKGKKINAISKLIQKVIRQGETIHNQLSKYRFNSSSNRHSCRRKNVERSQDTIFTHISDNNSTAYFNLRREKNCETDDEILLVLRPNDDDKDSGINIGAMKEKRLSKNLSFASDISFTHLPESEFRFPYPELNKTAKYEFVSSTPHTDSRRRKSLQFNVIRNEIVETTQGIEDLVQHEKRLTKHLLKKRDKYRAQNELYKTKAGLEMSIEEIQENLATYGKEIVDNELDLYKIKKEIKHRYIVLNNLTRMLAGKDATKYQSIRRNKHSRRYRNEDYGYNRDSLQFVDNIYEFCDKNESIVV